MQRRHYASNLVNYLKLVKALSKKKKKIIALFHLLIHLFPENLYYITYYMEKYKY